MIIVLLAEGFEELEALSPVDILRREGYEVKTVGITGKTVTGAHEIPVVADILPDEVELSRIEMVIFPGGMPGALNLDGSEYADVFINAAFKNGGHIAAICAAPLCFGRRGLLEGKRATCFPGFEAYLTGATVGGKVIRDGKVITAAGMGVAQEFGFEIISALVSPEKAGEIRAAIQSL